MSRFTPLSHLKHHYITPLQDAWQAAKITRLYPQLAPVVKAYQTLYPYSGAATSISVTERQQRGIEDDTLTYGETRWVTFLDALQELKIGPEDRFLDLGCGAGFLCFLVSGIYGIPATGVDQIGGFIDNANQIVTELNLPDLRFLQADFFELSFLPFSVFYATCTCFPEDVMALLSEKFEETAPGTRIITVTDPVEAPYIKLRKVIKAKFTWGQDHIFISERI